MTYRLRSALALAITAVVLAPTLAGAEPTEASDPEATGEAGTPGTTWALQPATDDEPDGRISLRHVIDGGTAVSDAVAVTNFGPRPETFAIYASDGIITDDGNFDLIPADEEATDSGTWITIGEVEGSEPREGGGIMLEVPAETTLSVPVEISVPANATPGDHPAGIVAELVPDAASNVQLASRVGVRAHLRVGGDIVADLAPDVTSSYSPSWNPFAAGTLTLTYNLTNTGNVRVGAQTSTTLSGPVGIGATTSVDEHREVLPGQVVSTTVEVPVWPTIITWADVSATPTVVGEDDVDTALTAVTSSFRLWTLPWAQLALVVLLVGGFFTIRTSRRRSAKAVQARIDAAVLAATSRSE